MKYGKSHFITYMADRYGISCAEAERILKQVAVCLTDFTALAMEPGDSFTIRRLLSIKKVTLKSRQMTLPGTKTKIVTKEKVVLRIKSKIDSCLLNIPIIGN